MSDSSAGARKGTHALPGWLVFLVLALIVALGLALRVAGSLANQPHVDEAFSLLGATMVAQKGGPLLPSGVLYLHGTTQSYLLAPLIKGGIGDIGDYSSLRLVSAAVGAVAILLTFRLARLANATAAGALFASLLVAIDPASVSWGGYVRMYAFAQALAVAVALLFLLAITGRPDVSTSRWADMRILGSLVIVFWLAVFTHLSTVLLWGAMAAVAIIIFGASLLTTRRDITAMLGACLLAPLVLFALTTIIGPGGGTAIDETSEGLPGISFLGDDNVNLSQILHPDPSPWTSLFAEGPLALVVPFLLALGSGILIGIIALGPSPRWHSDRGRSVGALLALYWLPVLALSLFASRASNRYMLYLLPIGYVLLALAAQCLVARIPGRGHTGWSMLGGSVLAIAVLLHVTVGTLGLDVSTPGKDGFASSATSHIASHRQPGELVLTSSSVATALILGSIPELRFYPGGEESHRSRRYTRLTSEGEPVDYWMGIPSLQTTERLCNALAESPGSWFLFGRRVWENGGYNDLPPHREARLAQQMRDLILGLADLQYEDHESLVFRSRPTEQWNDYASSTCEGINNDSHRGHERTSDDSSKTGAPKT